MTAHELARLLLDSPDHIVSDDFGSPITMVTVENAGIVIANTPSHPDVDGTFQGYVFEAYDNNELAKEWFNNREKIKIIRLS